MTDEPLRERVAAVEATVAEVRASLDHAVDRDIPLLKGALRAAIDAEIDEIEDLPDAGHAFAERLAEYETRLAAVERRLAAFGDVDTTADTKADKMAAVLTFALNKHDGRSKVAVSPQEVRGCAGVSRRYAYELIDATGDEVTGVTVREPQRVETGAGTEQKGKALLVDCEVVHNESKRVKQFTTDDTDEGVAETESKSWKCPNATRARRVAYAVGKTTVSASNAGCTSVRRVTRRSMLM